METNNFNESAYSHPASRSRLFILIVLITSLFNYSLADNNKDSLRRKIEEYRSPCAKPCLSDSVKVLALNSLAAELRFTRPDSSILYSKEALEIAEKIDWKKGAGQANLQLGLFYESTANYPLAHEHLNRALNVWDKMEKDALPEERIFLYRRRAAAYTNQAMVYSDQGLFEEALKSNEQAIAFYYKGGDTASVGAPTLNRGYLYKKMGKHADALKEYYQAMRIFEKFDIKEGISNAFFNIGAVLIKQQKYDEALIKLNQAIKVAEQYEFPKIAKTGLFEIANIYFNRKDFGKAHNYYVKVLNMYHDQEEDQLYYATCAQLGNNFIETVDWKQAMYYTAKGLDGHTKIGDKYNIAIANNQMGRIFLNEGDMVKAEQAFTRALALAKEMSSLEDIEVSNRYLHLLYRKKGNYKKALEYYEESVKAKDSLFNSDKSKEIAEIELQYHFDKKEAALLAEQVRRESLSNAEIEKQKLQRNASLAGVFAITLSGLFSFFFYKRKRDAVQRQKEALLRLQVSETEMKALRSQMNPHFIFNALQSIQAFLLNHHSEEANTYLLKFSKLMRAVLENSQHSTVPLKDDMETLELYMQLECLRFENPFTYSFNVDDSIDIEAVTIPPLLLQPFIENAIWHGLQYKNEPGHIQINISIKDNVLHVMVEDNGIGRLASAHAEKSVLVKKESLGMKLTEERLKIINEQNNFKSELQITDLYSHNREPQGTRVEVLLPLAA